MYSVRRAALRAASSSVTLTAGVTRQQVASLAMQFSKASARRTVAVPTARFFSQTVRFRQNEEASATEEASAVEESASEPLEDAAESPVETSQEASRRAQSEGHAIYIANMTFDATDMHLREAFGKYGTITDVSIGRDGRGLSRGFGFLTFAEKEAAEEAVKDADSSFWHGRRIIVQLRKERETRSRVPTKVQEPTTSLYIGNIPYETSDADLNRMFRELNNVTDVRVAVDRNTGWPRGFAHADFVDLASAIEAYEKLTKMSLGGRTLRIDYSEPRKGYAKKGESGGEGGSDGTLF